MVSVDTRHAWKLKRLAAHHQIEATWLGAVSDKRVIQGYIDLSLQKIDEAGRGGLEKLL